MPYDYQTETSVSRNSHIYGEVLSTLRSFEVEKTHAQYEQHDFIYKIAETTLTESLHVLAELRSDDTVIVFVSDFDDFCYHTNENVSMTLRHVFAFKRKNSARQCLNALTFAALKSQ